MIASLRALRGHLITLAASVGLSGLLVWDLRAPLATATRVEPAPSPAPAPSPSPSRLQVHVTGAVAHPGLVQLPEAARAAQAVDAAGGLLADADEDAVNLAAPVVDGQQLHVPLEGEPAAATVTPPASPTAPAAVGAPPSGLAAAPPGAPLDLNLAGPAELESLPGIGPALAARILEQRAAAGGFKSVEDLLRVPGIGPKTLAKFADRLVVR